MHLLSYRLWLLAGLFGLPPGIGVYLAVLRVLGSAEHGIALGAGISTAIGLGAVIIVLGATGTTESEP